MCYIELKREASQASGKFSQFVVRVIHIYPIQRVFASNNNNNNNNNSEVLLGASSIGPMRPHRAEVLPEGGKSLPERVAHALLPKR